MYMGNACTCLTSCLDLLKVDIVVGEVNVLATPLRQLLDWSDL